MEAKATIFLDIDGTILYHHGTLQEIEALPPRILPGVQDKLADWKEKGHQVILVTARPYRMLEATCRHLSEVGLDGLYDQIVCGCSHGIRYLVNDEKPTVSTTAFAITVKRNSGLQKLAL